MNFWKRLSFALPLFLSWSVSAGAQCATGTRIYIDPRLVPQRQQITKSQAEAIFANPYSSPEAKKYALDSYYNQNQPIQVPFRGRTVLISPNDPCIQ
jgi:hypothetical protein